MTSCGASRKGKESMKNQALQAAWGPKGAQGGPKRFQNGAPTGQEDPPGAHFGPPGASWSSFCASWSSSFWELILVIFFIIEVYANLLLLTVH